MENFYFDKLVGLNGKYIICGNCALDRTIGVNRGSGDIEVWTRYQSISDIDMPFVTYYFNPDLDKHFGEDCTISHLSPNIYIPTKERALVEAFKFIDVFTEVYTVEGMHNYLYSPWANVPLLREMADKYGLSQKELDYWMHEGYYEFTSC